MLLWAGWWAMRVKITIYGTPNVLHYCVIFTVYVKFANLQFSRRM